MRHVHHARRSRRRAASLVAVLVVGLGAGGCVQPKNPSFDIDAATARGQSVEIASEPPAVIPQ